MSVKHTHVKAFTLIEIITVVAVIGVLAAVISPKIDSWIGKSKIKTAADELHQYFALMKGESLSKGVAIKAEINKDNNSIAIYSSSESTNNCANEEVGWNDMNNRLDLEKIELISEVDNDELCFFSDGSSNGGKITLRSKYGEYEIGVLSATAFIEKTKIEE